MKRIPSVKLFLSALALVFATSGLTTGCVSAKEPQPQTADTPRAMPMGQGGRMDMDHMQAMMQMHERMMADSVLHQRMMADPEMSAMMQEMMGGEMDMAAMRERMALVRDELNGQASERLNRNMYLLSILSAVFLPLGFLTGLFGINVAGLPGTGEPLAFWFFVGALVIVAALQLAVLRRMRWI